MTDGSQGGRLAVVVPVHNEEANLRPLMAEIVRALAGGPSFELIYVDDASTDGTATRLEELAREFRELHCVRHPRRLGQCAAIVSGMLATEAEWIVTLDGDGQNDPADIPALLRLRDGYRGDKPLGLVIGTRVARSDSLVRRSGSRLANALRNALLGEAVPDTGCGTKLVRRQAFLAQPRLQNLHWLLPALLARDGWQFLTMPVNHRPRRAGNSKYRPWRDAWPLLADMLRLRITATLGRSGTRR